MLRRNLLIGVSTLALALAGPKETIAFYHGAPNVQIDLAGFGASTFSTTGSISSSSNTLNVADASGVAINDNIIIEIGGEIGAGARGTTGVGGTWPDLSYATVALMNADTGKPDGQYAWVVANSNVYQSFSGVWSQNTSYYTSIVIPRSLAAKITGKSGNTLTLDKNAAVATTSANVYFDNAPIFNQFGTNGTPDNRDLVWPAGNFKVSAACTFNGKSHWRILGAGKDMTTLSFPNGISDLGVIWIEQSNAPSVAGLTVSGNARDNGYMIAWLNSDQTSANYNNGIYIHDCTAPVTYDTKSIDCFQGLTVSFCANANGYRHDSVVTQGVYIERWQIQGADTGIGSFVDCTITSPTWIGGFEWFRSNNCKFIRCTSHNAFMAMNTDNGFTIDTLTMTMDGSAYTPLGVFGVQGDPFINVNSNIGSAGVAAGGLMTNLTLSQNGLVHPGVTNDTLFGIIVNVDNINVTVDGATVSLPNYTPPSVDGSGAVGYASDADNSTVKNFICHGTVKTGSWANLMFRGANSCYQNVTVDSRLGGVPC